VDTGSGTAIVYGGSGDETLTADGTADQIYAGNGNAYIEVASGFTTIFGSGGNDTILAGAGVSAPERLDRGR